MQILKIVKKLERIQNLTASELKATGAAFNNSESVIGCIKDYLEYEARQIDNELRKPKALYSKAGSEGYVAFRLAERAALLNLLDLLTIREKVIDGDQPEDV